MATKKPHNANTAKKKPAKKKPAKKKPAKKTPAKKTPAKKKPAKKTPAKKKPAKKTPAKKTPGKRRPPAVSPAPVTHRGPVIVGLGASAGGLEALEAFFANLQPDTGMAFVVVTHQHPGHTSLLPELLGKHTTLPVATVESATKASPNRVYLAPAGKDLALLNGTLQPMEPESSVRVKLPIDRFFRSLALDQGSRAVGIVLSGTGTDGTLGLKAIKGETGLTMVQDAEQARYDGMPRSAIATGLVDYVLAARDLPGQLVTYVRGVNGSRSEAPPSDVYNQILVLVRERTGHDLTGYKSKTIARRVERRMNLHQIEGLDLYTRFLRDNAHEVELLFRELLIGVTSFFRDPEAFEALERLIVRRLEQLEGQPTLRVWVPGCSTGEEAFSIAIIVRECLDRLCMRLSVQIFGTDLDSEAINFARNGTYPDGIAVDVGQERLSRFFVRNDSTYQISQTIREMVIFAPQNVIADPPFTRLDLLACRNLLIYLGGALQRRLLPLFHFVLRPGGTLFLGPSESVGSFSDLFVAEDKKWKLFRRGNASSVHRRMLEFPTARPDPAPETLFQLPCSASAIGPDAAAALIEHSVPPSVVVSPRGRVVYIHGRTGAFLEPPRGHAEWNIHDMARKGLEPVLSAALREAASKQQEVVHHALEVASNGEASRVDLVVRPISSPQSLAGMLLVSFEPSRSPAPRSRRKAGRETLTAELEQELRYTRESLQGTIEELETSNEELKSTNEELQSTNEELQSTNEELETSREEMQSLNEEMHAVNAELLEKVEELSRINDDMSNLLNSTAMATLFLDEELRIMRFTPQAAKVIRLIDADVGRPVGDIASELVYETLDADAREVLRSLVPREAELRSRDGKQQYLMRILPYRTVNNVIDGLVITFVDITELKLAEGRAQQAQALAEEVVDRVREPLVILDHDLRVVTINQSFCEWFGLSVRDVRGLLFTELGIAWTDGSFIDELAQLCAEQPQLQGRLVEAALPGHVRRTLSVTAHLVHHAGQDAVVMLSFEDVTV